jgi:hypothetical protein
MKLYLIILIAMCLNACSVLKSRNLESDNSNSNVEEFKIVFFTECISKALENELIFADDISYGHDFPLGIENYKLIDSLAIRINELIVKDSIFWQDKICPKCSFTEIERMKNEGMLGKRSLKYCLEYYNSYELDSIAKLNSR